MPASVVQALADAKPDAIFNVLFGADLAKFAREGKTRGLFKSVEVVSLLTGEPEYLDPLKDDAPDNWYVTGYPWYLIKTPEHTAFLDAYQKRYNDYPAHLFGRRLCDDQGARRRNGKGRIDQRRGARHARSRVWSSCRRPAR